MEGTKKYLPYILRTLGIAAAYAVVTLVCTLVVGSYSWGPVQFRLSEALCVLALFTPEAIPGLALGCAVANIINLIVSNLGSFTALGVAVCLLLPIAGAIFARRLREHPYLAMLAVLVANVAIVVALHQSFGTIGVLDVLLGALATTLGAIFTWKHHERKALAVLGPVIANAIIVPAYLPLMLDGMGYYVIPFTAISAEGSYVLMYLFGFVAVALGEAAVMYILGLPLARLIKGTKLGALLEGDAEEITAAVESRKASASDSDTE